MIEIKCYELQKDAIINALGRIQYCVIGCNVDCECNCFSCLNDNIKRIIRGNEEWEKYYSRKRELTIPNYWKAVNDDA